MGRFLGGTFIALFATACGTARADEKEARAVIDRAIKSMGGEGKLTKADAATWKAHGTITSVKGDTNDFDLHGTVKGLDHFRSDYEGQSNGNAVKTVIVLAGEKGWQKRPIGLIEMEGDALANMKRTVYLQAVAVTFVPLKGKDFKVDSAPDENVGDKPAAVVKVTGPDGRDFKLFFDKESGLPAKMVATMAGPRGNEYIQETMFSGYKAFDG
jgi:hypothetical protein